jgi:hypothetical protein
MSSRMAAGPVTLSQGGSHMPKQPSDDGEPLQATPPALEAEQELSDEQLDTVAGGTGSATGRLPDIDQGHKTAVDL